MREKSNFELLCDKEILSILMGDKDYGKLEVDGADSNIVISMPYLPGQLLRSISEKFGFPATSSSRSRWEYLDDLLKHCIKNKRESELLEFIFSKGQFKNDLKDQTHEVIEYAYAKIVDTIISRINKRLYFNNKKLVQTGKGFAILELESTVTVAAPYVNMVDRSYITDMSKRAMNDVIGGNYDSAITKSRTLLEEVFCHVIEGKGEEPSESGDIKKLYNQVKQLCNMHQNKDMDKRINGLLSGLEKILSSIAEMRNKGSDSHGIGAKRINIADHHARLFVNSAITMAEFILAVGEKTQGHVNIHSK